MRFTGVGRDRKYEIRNTKLQPMSKVQGRYNVPGTKYKVEIRIGIEVLVFKDLGTSYLVLGT
jgi:hypothetical protein